MVRVLKSHPGILRYDVESRLEPHAVWLEEEGLTKAGVAKVLSKLPQVSAEVFSIQLQGRQFAQQCVAYVLLLCFFRRSCSIHRFFRAAA